jgi:predicted O-methyltransferase YrrM
MNNLLFGDVDQYINGLFADEDAVLKSTEKAIVDAGIPQISISANQGKFLQILAKLSHAKRILEIGTLGGYSTIWMARALPANGKLISLEISPVNAAVAQKNIDRAGLTSIVDIRIGKALDLLPRLEKQNDGPFDMIFIDADKPPYAEYFQWAVKLSRPGTLIVADNVIREGKVMEEKPDDEMVAGARRFNEALARDTRVSATIIQTVGAKEHDGMALAIVK